MTENLAVGPSICNQKIRDLELADLTLDGRLLRFACEQAWEAHVLPLYYARGVLIGQNR